MVQPKPATSPSLRLVGTFEGHQPVPSHRAAAGVRTHLALRPAAGGFERGPLRAFLPDDGRPRAA